MKKILFFVVFALCGLQMKAAEQFDELNLRGGWELVSYTGSYDVFTTPEAFGALPAISDCKFLYVGDLTSGGENHITVNLPGFSKPIAFDYLVCSGLFYKPELQDAEIDEDDYELYTPITDCFISNGNKLHFIIWNGALHFVIDTLTANELIVKSFDGNFTANYKRISSASSVKELNAEASAKEEIYDLKGVKASSSTDGIKIIRRGEKVTKKIK